MTAAATLALEKTAPRQAAAATCTHCGTLLVPGSGPFCCSGCAAAYRLINQLGLARYYERRSLDEVPHPVASREAAADLAVETITEADGTKTAHLMVDGLHCAACVWLIESALERQPGVVEARVNRTTQRLRLRWSGDATSAARLADLVQRLGYRAVPYDPARLAESISEEERRLLRALAIGGFAAANVMLLSVAVWAGAGEMGQATRDLLHWISALITLPAIAYAGQPFFRSAIAALRYGKTNMDVPISVAVILGGAVSLVETFASGPHAYFESVAMLLFFLLIGRYLDLRARGRARSAVEHLLGLTTRPVSVIGAEGVVTTLGPSAVPIGSTVLVTTGERVLVDGKVVEGRSTVDKSLVDGENTPLEVAPGSIVLAGMVNLSAPLRITVTASGDRTFLADIVRLMEAAERGRPRLVMLSDRVAKLYAPAVHILALATFGIWLWIARWEQALLNAIAVLIITCPCALGLAVPAVQVIAGGRLLRRGILLKSGTALERLSSIDTVIFDKTGTLTFGQLALANPRSYDPDALRVAASLAAASRHPLARALQQACPDAPVIAGVRDHPGAGLSVLTEKGEVRLGSRVHCRVAGCEDEDSMPELWLARPGAPPCRFTFKDTLRPDAAAVIAKLRRSRKRVILLSGDRAPAVEDTARALGIADWQAGVSPEAKVAALATYAARGDKVLMVGDGLNDAPALAAAFVSISPANAADVSQTAADVVFQGRSLAAVTEILEVAERSMRLVKQNISMAIIYNAFAVPLSMFGLVTPLLAAIAMSTSSSLVVSNASRAAKGCR